MPTTIFFSNRFDVLTTALTSILNHVTDERSLFDAPAVIIVPSSATADYLRLKICASRGQNGQVGVTTGLRFVSIEQFIEMMSQGDVVILKRNLIFAALLELAKQGQLPDVRLQDDGSLSEESMTRLEARAAQLEKAIYANVKATRASNDHENWARFCRTNAGWFVQRILEYVESTYHVKLHLPFDIFQRKVGTVLNFMPHHVFWFDPEPLGRFEQMFLERLIEQLKHEEKACSNEAKLHHFTILTFSPCEGYWTDCKTGVRNVRNSVANLSVSSVELDDDVADSDSALPLSNWWKNHNSLVERCGRISQCVGAAMVEYLTKGYNVKDVSLHLPLDPEWMKSNPCVNAVSQIDKLCALHQLQCQTIKLTEAETREIKFDESLQVRAFETPRESVAWVADEIVQILNKKVVESVDEITILIPSNVSAAYASFLQSALQQRHIQANIRGILNTNQASCYDALEALIPLLSGDWSRPAVLNWMFQPAIVEEAFVEHVDAITRWVDAYGILHDFDASTRQEQDYLKYDPDEGEVYTWKQGMRRVALGFAQDHVTSPSQAFPPVDESVRDVCVRWLARVRALFRDIEGLRAANLSWTDWQNVLYTFLDAWINTDAANREEEMRAIRQRMRSTWPSYAFLDQPDSLVARPVEAAHTLDEVLPLLKIIAGKLSQSYPGQMLGGVQIRPLTGDIQTSPVVFMMALENENFPSKAQRQKSLERFSRYDIDANAFLKWFDNATERLYLCTCALDIGERDLWRKQNKSYVEIRNNIADRSAIFVSDILRQMTRSGDDEDFGLIPNVREPIDRMRIEAFKNIKNVVQQSIGQNANDDKTQLTAEMGVYKANMTPENFNTVCQQLFHEGMQPSCGGPEHANDEIIPFSFKDFADFLEDPGRVYRNVRFGIVDYEETLPATMRLKASEPFQLQRVSGHFETFGLIRDLLNNVLIRFEDKDSALAEIMVDYDHITKNLQCQGVFPAGFYAQHQRQQDRLRFQQILMHVEALVGQHKQGFVYVLDDEARVINQVVQHAPSVELGEVRRVVLDPFVEPSARYVLKGVLARLCDDDTMFMVGKLKKRQALFTQAVLAVARLPQPTWLVHVDCDKFGVKRYSLPKLDSEYSKALLELVMAQFDCGHHEFSGSGGFSEVDQNKLRASELFSYAGRPNFVPQATRESWEEFDQKREAMGFLDLIKEIK